LRCRQWGHFRFVNHAPSKIISPRRVLRGRTSRDMQSLALIIFPILMAYAASSDLLTMKIANWLIAALIVSYFALAMIAGVSWNEIGMNAAAGVLVLVFSFAFFVFGWIGGGDAKLVAATAMWVGFPLLLPYVVYAALLGGGLTLIIIAMRRYPLPAGLSSVKWIDRLHDNKSGVPYGIALAIAGLLV
jgi:prepilin peptidase CpaA